MRATSGGVLLFCRTSRFLHAVKKRMTHDGLPWGLEVHGEDVGGCGMVRGRIPAGWLWGPLTGNCIPHKLGRVKKTTWLQLLARKPVGQVWWRSFLASLATGGTVSFPVANLNHPYVTGPGWQGRGHMANCTACVSICEQKPYREVRSAYGILVAKGFDPHQCACVYVSPVCDSEKRWRMVKSLLREYHDWTATVTKDRMRPQSYHRIQNPWENRNTCSILLPERPRIAY